MMPRATKLLAILALLLGMIHMAFLPLAYAGWTLDALWFAGTGLAIMAAAAINLIQIDGAVRSSRYIILSVNIALAVFFLAAWWVLPAPQVIIAGVLFIGLAVLQFRKPKGEERCGRTIHRSSGSINLS